MSAKLSPRALASLAGVSQGGPDTAFAKRSLMYLYRRGLIAQVLDEGRFLRWELTTEGGHVLAHGGRLMRSGRREVGSRS